MTTTYVAIVAKNLIEQDIDDYVREHGPMGHALSLKYRQLLADVDNWEKTGNKEMIDGLIQSFKLGD